MGFTSYLSWSYSRAKMYKEGCPRMFFFEYYKEGEDFENDARMLKSLTFPKMVAGTVVDWSINQAIKTFKESGESMYDLPFRGVKTFRRLIERSPEICRGMRTDGGYQPPRESQPLHGHFYGIPVDDGELEGCEQRISNALFNFESSEVWENIKDVPTEKWSRTKTNSDINAEKWHFKDDLLVWASLDFWYRDEDRLYIFDWKSGMPTEKAKADALLQMAIYTLWGRDCQQLPVEKISTQVVYLSEQPVWEPSFVPAAVVRIAEDTIISQYEYEKRKLRWVGQDRRDNDIYEANLEDFEPRPELVRCLNCKYRILCPPGQLAAQDPRND
ncbi:MAG: PD-(D/E)XK nuclease family protein [Armatimonadetes bacterium]|nr:PD-(D/E)XK nuclease family protein [Armatimonadota bacterium]